MLPRVDGLKPSYPALCVWVLQCRPGLQQAVQLGHPAGLTQACRNWEKKAAYSKDHLRPML